MGGRKKSLGRGLGIQPIGHGERATRRHRLPSCGSAVPPQGSRRRGLGRLASHRPPSSAPAQATRIRFWDIRLRKVAANFLACFARPSSLPDPPPCGAGNSEGRSARRDGEWGGLQRTLETEACKKLGLRTEVASRP